MAQTTATLVNNIRLLLRDARLNDLAIGTFQLRRLIENRVFYAADRLGTGETRTSAAIAITGGSYEFNLSLSPISIVDVLFDATATPLIKVTEQDIDQWRRGGGTVTPAQPLYYAPIYRAADVWKIQVHPPGTGTLTVISRLLPGGLADDDTTSIAFDDGVLRGIEQLVASDAIPLMIAAKAAERGLSAEIGQKWERLGDAALDAAWPRLNQGLLRDFVVVRMGGRR